MIFKNIANKLGLIEDAAEGSITKAIDAIENRATAAEALVKTKDTEILNLTKTVGEKETEILNLKTQLGAAAQAKKDAEDAAGKTKAKDYVANLVKSGKIKNEKETIEEWEAEYFAKPERVEKMFGALTTSRKAEGNIANQHTPASDDALSSVAASTMAEVRAKQEKQPA